MTLTEQAMDSVCAADVLFCKGQLIWGEHLARSALQVKSTMVVKFAHLRGPKFTDVIAVCDAVRQLKRVAWMEIIQ
ncbi:hypothetical protein R5W24_003338 [Gemmata sp. JC717]|uniref:hypothetical protein n=1 Tax=Gemmata algarum TaxID=2975278 RepID=UPI0021BB1863|nr:hypothetical protein [Gemmata algarum]MDY3554219.1 hypothetical protein [Gemmata algarum]